MIPDIIPLPYQVFYTVIPTISIIGNAAIIYVTVRSKMVVCAITAPITGHIYIVFTKSILLINILILICYISFIFFIKKLRMSNKDAKHIYRSLIIVSVTVVFGGFSTMLFDFFTEFFHLNVERLYSNLLAGLFVNCAAATNFFVYYIMSKEYRRLFDEYLLIGYVKRNILKINDASSTIILSTLKTVH
ncbi:hypothetical protein DICVIV_10015 [Dictyocaulus viviparus]|uniref:G-protein coupled receptors family 1 profile domain-containing protein n=1 Tax=Dictyocaulus viviparus TaxID=29172 RepID=A0A0D8XJF7_DICVI|nr:hypothetical protein DICVIV_10015 [Dictyocaulus viviparus]